MSDTNLFWGLRGTYAERTKKLAESPRAWLEASILDREYNDFLRSRSDLKDDEPDPRDMGKRLPYIGWFWRHLNFSEGRLPLGWSDGLCGFIANNKWDHPERDTTPEEFAKIMEIIDAAMAANEKGGLVSDIISATHAELEKLWAYLATLQPPPLTDDRPVKP